MRATLPLKAAIMASSAIDQEDSDDGGDALLLWFRWSQCDQ